MSISGRTRTPSDIKWLLTERAYLAGEIQQLDAQRQLLAKKLAEYSRRCDRLASEAQQADRKYQAKLQAREAIEHTLSLVSQSLPGGHEQVLVMPRNLFGRLGALRDFLESELRQCAPAWQTTSALADAVLCHFKIDVYLPEVRRAVRRSVASTLLRMSKLGLLDSVTPAASGESTQWRWNEGPVLTLTEKMALRGALTNAAHDDASAN